MFFVIFGYVNVFVVFKWLIIKTKIKLSEQENKKRRYFVAILDHHTVR